ncbi:hypothetical protein AAZX31_10G281200 [Glycine max]|nr:hypothetical protein JHK86_029711 [Glycine max]
MTKVQPKKDFTLSQKGSRKKAKNYIEILHTETLIKEVEKVFTATARHPDHMEIFNFNNNDGSKYKMVIKCSISVSARLL